MDKVIKCIDCQQEFAFTEGEQIYFEQNQLSEPVRCAICRAIYKAGEKDEFRGKVTKT